MLITLSWASRSIGFSHTKIIASCFGLGATERFNANVVFLPLLPLFYGCALIPPHSSALFPLLLAAVNFIPTRNAIKIAFLQSRTNSLIMGIEKALSSCLNRKGYNSIMNRCESNFLIELFCKFNQARKICGTKIVHFLKPPNFFWKLFTNCF